MTMKTRHRKLWRQGLGRDVLSLGLLLVLCLLFFWPVLTPRVDDRGSFREGDFYVQTYACNTYKARMLLSGHYPLWNPYVYSGHPFLADVQNSPLYPFSLLTVLLSAPWGYSVVALELEAVAHFFLAAAFGYFLGRRLFRDRAIALLVAAVFTFGGYLTSFPPLQLPILETAVWLPLVLLLLDLASEKLARGLPLALLYCALAGLAWGVAILAGHPQTAMHVLYLSLAWYAFRALSLGRDLFLPGLAGLVFFVLAGAGIAAIQLLPAAELMRLSIRASATYQDLSGGFALKDLVQVVLPGIAGYWSPLYVGILPLAWVLFAWLVGFGAGGPGPSRRWRREVVFWTASAIVALLLALGDETFFFSLWYLVVPGFDLFRSQERIALVFSLSFALLMGYGLRHFASLAAHPEHREAAHGALNRLLCALLVGMGTIGLFMFFGQTQAGSGPGSLFSGLLGLVVFLSLVLGLGWLWNRFWSLRSWRHVPALAGLLLLFTLDLFTLHQQTNVQDRRPERQVQSLPLIEVLQASEADGPFRIDSGGWYLPGNAGCIFGLEDTAGASQLQLADYASLRSRLPVERVWELLNVRYVVTWQAALQVPSDVVYQTTTRQGEDVYLHRLLDAAPRVWAVFEAEVAGGDQLLDRLSEPGLSRRLALLEAPLAVPLPGEVERPAKLELAVPSAERLHVQADMPARGLLLFSELYYPGWQARVDGQRVPIHRANGLLRAVEVPAGVHQIEMEYRPASVYAGIALSLLACFLILGYTLFVAGRSRRKARRSRSKSVAETSSPGGCA